MLKEGGVHSGVGVGPVSYPPFGIGGGRGRLTDFHLTDGEVPVLEGTAKRGRLLPHGQLRPLLRLWTPSVSPQLKSLPVTEMLCFSTLSSEVRDTSQGRSAA